MRKRNTKNIKRKGFVRALVYARVSSDRQKKEGNGLDSQELRCRQYCEKKGYEVEAVFRDSFTGGGDYMKRPAMAEMLDYLSKHAHCEFVIVFDDLKRLARDVVSHWQLRRHISELGATVESPNFEFRDDDDNSWLNEAMNAVLGESERRSNRRQVIQKQKARLESGYWAFNSDIPGYKRNSKEERDWILVRREPEASVVQEAFEGYASGRFRTLSDVVNFVRERRLNGDKKVYLGFIKRMFSRSLYAGFIEYEPWEVYRRKGHHEPIISPEVFEQVQVKMSGRTFKRTIDRPEFPLKGLILCSQCNRRFTAAWSTGRKKKKYPYYRCQGIYCKQKDVRKEKIEGDFEEFLKKIQPKKGAVSLVERIVQDVWRARLKDQDKVLRNHKRHQEALLKEKDQILAKIIKTENEAVLRTLETKVELVEKEISEIGVNVSNQTLDEGSYGTALNMIINLLKNPIDIWQNGGYDEKRLVIRLVFSADPIYDRELGYGTADLSIGVRLFEQIGTQKLQDVEMVEIESTSENVRQYESTVRSFT